eukprot:NODE_543_length_6231_cov_0.300718.p6 type:complete len:107 gc:universal NODE_543_length_6231_cov_0.300718:4460-4780(+)
MMLILMTLLIAQLTATFRIPNMHEKYSVAYVYQGNLWYKIGSTESFSTEEMANQIVQYVIYGAIGTIEKNKETVKVFSHPHPEINWTEKDKCYYFKEYHDQLNNII